MVDAELVGHDDIAVIGDPDGEPVVAADGLHPPDLLAVGEGDAVGFVGAVLLQQHTQPLHAFPGGVDIGQDHIDKVLFPQTAGDLFALPARLGLVADHGVGGQDPGIGGDGLGGGHGHIGGVDAVGRPYPVGGVHAGGGGVAQGVIGQLDLQMADLAFILPELVLGLDHDELLYVKKAVVVAGDHGGAVIAGVFANQNGGTRHRYLPLSLDFITGETVYSYDSIKCGAKPEKYGVVSSLGPALFRRGAGGLRRRQRRLKLHSKGGRAFLLRRSDG